MDHYMETSATWNRIASLYQERFMELDLYNATYDFFCASVATNTKVLDIGCGPGNITKYILTKRPDLQLEGIDVAPNMIALAKQNNPQASFSVMDSRQIDQLDATYGGISCGFCLPYLTPPDAQKMISDVFNLLADDGVFYLSFVEGSPSESGFKSGSSGDRVYFHFYELEAIKNQLADAGFDTPEIFRVDYQTVNEADVHTILITKKRTNPTIKDQSAI